MIIICFGKNYFLATRLSLTLNFCPITGHLTSLKVSMCRIPKVFLGLFMEWRFDSPLWESNPTICPREGGIEAIHQ